jgi:hypothetical protein
MKKILLIATILFASITGTAFASDINLTIRDGNTIVYTGTVPLQVAGTIQLNGHDLNAESVLSVLNDADILSDSFQITDLQYYDSMNSFYLKCINGKCDNWQYTVNDAYPGIGMDQKILSGGESVYLYFGQQHQINLSSTSLTTADTLTVNAENYVYQNNTWEPLTGITIGLTQPDPNNPWSPTEVLTNAVDNNGQVTFSAIPEGSYNVGIKEDFYFPTTTLTITLAPTPEPEHHSSGGSYVSASPVVSKPVFDTKKALNFLTLQQKENGSFGEELYTDWTSIAFVSNVDYQEQKTKLIKYFSENKFTGTSLTDYERHAMALMVLNLNPYNINGENYIQKITSNFDGEQFGDKNTDNDDIFALIVLQNAGYTTKDEMIQKTINFILSKQKQNGSWDESIDLTGAGIQSLISFNQDEKVKTSLEKAKSYLKEKQNANGSWENVSSTSWAMQGIIAIGGKIDNTTLEYLGENQDTDGGIKEENIQNRIWQTSYAINAVSEKTWNNTMQKFEKPVVVLTNPVIEKVNNSNQTKFIKKIEKFQKPAPTIEAKQIQEEAPVQIKKKNIFRRIFEALFGF